MRCGFKISKGFETGSDRFNLSTASPGSVFSASCNPLGSRFGSFTVREFSEGDRKPVLRYGETSNGVNIPLGIAHPWEGLYLSPDFEKVSENLRRLEMVSEVGAAVRAAGLGFVAGRVESELLGEPPAPVSQPRAETILPPAPVSVGKVSIPAPKLPGDFELSPFRFEGPNLPETIPAPAELPSEVPAIPCAETSETIPQGDTLPMFKCEGCGKSYAHKRSLSRHLATCAAVHG